MSRTDRPAEHPEAHVSLAAEHALGVLSGADRRDAEQRAASDPAYRAELRAWEGRLAGLADEAPVRTPPDSVWDRVRESAVGPPIPLAERRRAAPARDANGRRLAFWKAATGIMATAAAACLALAVVGFNRPERVVVRERPAPAAPAPMMAAELTSDGRPLLMVAYDPVRSMALLVPMTSPTPDPEHSHELWLIPADGAPRSLGVLDLRSAHPMPMRTELAPLMGERAVLAVTVEPVGGSPTGQPSGAPIATGEIAAI